MAAQIGCRSMPLGITPQQINSARGPILTSKGVATRDTRTAWRIATLARSVGTVAP
jgi:hypothetical protein